MPIPLSSSRPFRLLGAALALVVLVAACDGPRSRATFTNVKNVFALFAITGAPANAPTAFSFFGGTVAADANFGFDVAFDIDEAGATRLYPVRSLASGMAAGLTKRIGLQIVPGTTFEGLREAPRTGYDTAGYQVVTPGAVIAVEILDLATCQYSIGGYNIYAKMVIDSVHAGERRVFGRTVFDPNCGFRELMPDSIPER